MADATAEEVLHLNQRLLDAIGTGDWAAYEQLCDPTLTSFEPEALGQLVEGLDFHRFYFNVGGFRSQQQTTMCSPRVRVMGDVAVVAYTRLNQRVGEAGSTVTIGYEETRVWHLVDGRWRHVHFHRSRLPT